MNEIGNAAAPTGARRLIGNRGLPLCHLVAMGKKLRWRSHRLSLILAARQRIKERSNIKKGRQLAFPKKRLKLHTPGMKTVKAPVSIERSNRQNPRLGNREVLADR